jgi:hypothetical protein
MTCFRLDNGQTLCKWCKEKGITYQYIWRLLEQGMSVEEACKKVIESKGKRRVKYYYNGTPVVDICGGSKTLSYFRFQQRLYKGFSIEEALKGIIK